MALLALCIGMPERGAGQGTVAWQNVQPTPDRPAGTVWSYTVGSAPASAPAYTSSTQPFTFGIPPRESGADWWLSHENVYDANGQLIGIVACGRTFTGNWTMSQPCETTTLGGLINPHGQETYDTRWGTLRQIVGYYSPEGVLQWFRFLDAGGYAYGVTVDRQGYLIVVGEASNHDPFPETGSSPSYFNPTPGNQTPVSSLACLGAGQLSIAKLDQSGNVLWHHYYNSETIVSTALTQRCVGQHVVETNTGNQTGYRVVGWQYNGTDRRPCIIDVDIDGMRLGTSARLNTVPGMIGATDGDSRAMYISRCPFAAGERFAVTGFRTLPGGGVKSAWVMYMDDAIGTTIDAEWTRDVQANAFANIDLTLPSNATRVAFTMDGAQPRVVWPLLYDYVNKSAPGASLTAGDIFASWTNREAKGRVYKFDGSGNLLWTSPDLGLFRANDLFFSVKPMANGDYAITSTKAAPGFGIDNPFDFADMNSGITDCLTSPAEPDGLGYDPDGSPNPQPPYPWATQSWDWCGHYGTDSYVAILRNGSGSLLWQYQWDEGLGTVPTTCFPENWRQRQCDFELTVDPAGDLLVCGNTGHNKDDGYLARIQTSCDAKADYTLFESIYGAELAANNNVVNINGLVNWTQSMNVRGSIVINPGGTLNITGPNTVIRFADSRKMGYTCNIVVMPDLVTPLNAGNLNIRNGATVTSLAECPESMWDGIRVLGTNNNDALSSVGELRIGWQSPAETATISNALVAASNCQVDPMNPTTATATDPGGAIIVDNGIFLNNRFGVVMRPFYFPGNNTAPDPNAPPPLEAAANSRFFNSQFGTTTALNYAQEAPQAHIWLRNVKRTRIGSCTFWNSWGPAVEPAERWGSGVVAQNTPVQILPLCTGNVFNPGCAGTNGLSVCSFTGLLRGFDFTTNFARTCMSRFNLYDQCAGGVRLLNAHYADLQQNDFVVPAVSTVNTNFNSAYGFGVWGARKFKIENNHVQGYQQISTNPPTVGAVFDNTGDSYNEYYNNTFDKLAYGTLIQFDNEGPATGDGLNIRCNDYGTTLTNGDNYYDIAFTDVSPQVGDRQGSPGTASSPAGNTFSSLCSSPETQMFVPLGVVSTFAYWHHSTTPGFVLKPVCRTDPPIVNPWFNDAIVTYDKTTACPGYIAMVGNGSGQQNRMSQAQEESQTIRTLYDLQRDGGDTEGLKDYIDDPGHTSADVRSELMLAAPRVSIEVWQQVFARDPALNPWHMAQALQANSPLQPEVVRMMEESELTPFYKQLVYGAQGEGVSSLTILESELGHWKHEHSKALTELVNEAMTGDGELTVADALNMEESYPENGTPWARISLLISIGDLSAARALIHTYLNPAEPDGALQVMDLALELEIGGTSLADAPQGTRDLLTDLANSAGNGNFAAQAMLRSAGLADFGERIILPTERRSLSAASSSTEDATELGLLSVYPNPSDGKQPVYLVANKLEGMDELTVRVLDPLGREVLVRRLNGATGIVELETKSLVNGTYVAGLFADGTQVANVKFQVIR